MKQVSIKDIQQAQKTLQKFVHRTSIDYSQGFSNRFGSQIFLKRENEQKTGSFKIRGATNKIQSLSSQERAQGVIACSAGNHAQGVALSASLAGVRSVIVMPESAPLVKMEASKEYGAEVILHGSFYDEAAEHALHLAKEKNYILVHPYEDSSIIAGQGTIGLEILEDLPDLDSVVVPVGGGGLISGIASAVKALRPECKVFGVQSAGAPGMAEAFRDKKMPFVLKRLPTIADGISVKTPSPYMYENYISKYVDDMVTVSEDELAEAIVMLLERTKAVVEGAGAASLAALLGSKLKLGKKTCLILSGGNIDLNVVEKVIDRGLSRHGRICRMSVIVADVPGTLNSLTECLAKKRANILQVSHDRGDHGIALMETRIDFLLETNGTHHIHEIRNAVKDLGVRLI